MNVPPLGDSISKGEVVEWVKQVGEYCHADDELCTMETDKVTFPVRCEKPGEIVEIYVNAEEEVKVGEPLVKFKEAQAPASAQVAVKSEPTPSTEAATTPTKEAAPAAKAATPATIAAAPTKAAAPKATPPQTVSFSSFRNEKRVKMTPMRKKIAERLIDAQSTAALLTTFNEVDMSKFMAMRAKYKDQFEKLHGVKLGLNGIFVAAATAALQEIPVVNAIIDDKELVYREYCDVSVAVSSPRGLVTPVLRDTQNMKIADIERGIAHLGAKARNGEITMEDMAGGTFTVTNGGVFGSLMSTPMLNMPQAAILGLHAVKERPVTVDGVIVSRPMMYVALTYDHRIIDGRESVTFLKSIKQKVEDPERFLFGL